MNWRRIMRRISLPLVLCLVSACQAPEPVPLELRGGAIGTTWSITVVTDRPGRLTESRIERLVNDRFDLIVGLMSNYQDDSELSRFNTSRSTAPVAIAAETADVIAHAMEIGELSNGAFDITVGPLVAAWGFGPVTEPVVVPTNKEIARLLNATGHGHLVFDLHQPSLAKTVPELELDFSAVAKGYAIDLVAEALSAQGFDRFLVEVGGEIRVRGTNPDNRRWRLAVERPQEMGRAFHTTVELSSGSLATSGDYRNYREVNGNRVSHIIDPRTGRPISHGLASVSVIDELCVRADGLSTALLVLGPDDGYALAERQGIPALFLIRDGNGGFTRKATAEFEKFVVSDR
jgi:thiamine biosynthesis lipoprotein